MINEPPNLSAPDRYGYFTGIWNSAKSDLFSAQTWAHLLGIWSYLKQSDKRNYLENTILLPSLGCLSGGATYARHGMIWACILKIQTEIRNRNLQLFSLASSQKTSFRTIIQAILQIEGKLYKEREIKHKNKLTISFNRKIWRNS